MAYDDRDDDWASQVPERRWRGPYEDYGWERGESGLPEFRDPSVHRQSYDRGFGGMEGRHYGGELPFREGRVPFERSLGDQGYERPRRRNRMERVRRDYSDYERGRMEDYSRDFDRWNERRRRERYTPAQRDFDRASNRAAYGRTGAPAARYGTSDVSRSGNYGLDQEYSASDAGMAEGEWEPVGWSYTEIWVVPGPMTGRGPKGYQTSDERIYEEVCERMTRHGELDPSDIEVKTENGEVTLEGTVPDRRMKRLAEDLAEQAPGVRDVHNHLRVQQIK
jgi:osmotically-inducible protein OsmY